MHTMFSLCFTARSFSFFNYEDEFKAFQEAEIKLWCDWGIKQLKKELISASDNIITASLAHQLHNSSFITTKVHNSCTADSFNSCTALIMINDFNDKIIMIDHVIQWEVKDSFIYYSQDILTCHEQHLFIICKHMLASVEVVYSVFTWNRTLQYLQGRLQSLNLWGSYQDIKLFLKWDSVNTADCTSERQLQHFLIAAFHSQNLLREWLNSFKPAQNTLLKVTYSLAEVWFISQFFKANMWQKQIDVLLYAYSAVNKSSEHELRLTLKALHELSLRDADSEIQKRSTQLHAVLTSDLKWLMRIEDDQASSEAPFTSPSLSSSAFRTTMWLCKFNFLWSHLLRDSEDLDDLSPEVSCMCVCCWEATVIDSERCTIEIDSKPHWINTISAKYVERWLLCQNCDIQRWFISIDEKTSSIPDTDLNKIYNSVCGFSQKV